MSFTSKILKTLGAASVALAMSQASYAAVATPFTILDGHGGTLAANVSSFDWSEAGSGLAVGVGLPSSLNAGQTFTFQYQAALGNYTVGTTNYTGSLGTAYEITAVATIGEIVNTVTTLADGNTSVTFSATGGTLKLYYSTVVNSNVAAGTGFNDGILIATFNVKAGGQSALITDNSNESAGGYTQYSLDAVLASVDSAYLTAASGITGMTFTSSQTLPVGTSDTVQVNGVSSNTGTLLKVDGSSTLTTTPAVVPEPSILALMSLGLVGLGFGARRRKS